MNDLWKYSITNNTWTWISGSDVADEQGFYCFLIYFIFNIFFKIKGIYGTKGISSSNNIPGARLGSSSWIDNNGNFWLFGGHGYDMNGNQGN